MLPEDPSISGSTSFSLDPKEFVVFSPQFKNYLSLLVFNLGSEVVC